MVLYNKELFFSIMIFIVPFLNLIYLLLFAFVIVNIADFNSAILGERFWLLYIRWPEGETWFN